MKNKILYSMFAVSALMMATSCDDDESYSPAEGQVVSSVTTGTTEVTPNSATLHATISGDVSQLASSAYSAGFYYGSSQDNLSDRIPASVSGSEMTATLNGLSNGQTVYYQAYLTFKDKVTYKGDVMSLTTADASVTTADAKSITFYSAALNGTLSGNTGITDAGFVISAKSDAASVHGGLAIKGNVEGGNVTVTKAGLLPNTTYYYATFLSLGKDSIFGNIKSFTTDKYNFDPETDLVDLGLSTKWAKCNLGASKETEEGGLYGYGDLTGVLASVIPAEYGTAANIYGTQYDVVYQTLGSLTLPTQEQFDELYTLCKSEWVIRDGVSGVEFTGPNGNKLFLPAAGVRTASKVSGAGETGYYMTGSIAGNTDFCLSYSIADSKGARISSPRFSGLSVRPVSNAKKFNKQLLNTTWYLDINPDADNHHYFDGPIYYYGSDDCWASVSDGLPAPGSDSWNWAPVYPENTWLGENRDYGYMTFKEDGTYTIVRKGSDAASQETVNGKYTIDEAERTITLEHDILGFANFNSLTLDAKTKLKILSLNQYGLQVAILRDPALSGEGACLLSYNYFSEAKRLEDAKIPVSIMAVGSDWNGTWGIELTKIEQKSGTYTVKYDGVMNGAQVLVLDFVGLMKINPSATVTINSLKADGNAITLDKQLLIHGDIEGNGNYRVEFYNAWGKTATNGSPLSGGKVFGADSADTDFSCTSSLEISFKINF